MTMFPTRPQDRPASAPGVEVRTYKTDHEMATDAAAMKASGFAIAGQVTRKSSGGIGLAIGVLLIVVGILLYVPLVILGLILMLASYITRSSETVVTYNQGAAPARGDTADQLKKLGELRDAGVLTQAEFDAKKAELLVRL